MKPLQILHQFIIWMIGFTPVWAYIIWRTRINGKKWFMFATLTLSSLTILLSYNPLRIPKVTSWFHYYTLFIVLYTLIFTYALGFHRFNKAFAMSIFMVFVASEWWEIPVFIYDYFGVLGGLFGGGIQLNSTRWFMSHIHRVYVLVSFFLFTKVTNFKFNRVNASLLLLGSALSFLFLAPLRFLFVDPNTVTRITCLGLFGLIGYFGVKHNDF